MEREMTGEQICDAIKMKKGKFYTLYRAGKIPGTRLSPRKSLFNLGEVKAALAGEGLPPPRGVSAPKATSHDEDDPNFDELELEEDEIVARVEHEAQEALMEAVTSAYLDEIQKARKKRRGSLVRKLLAKLTEIQTQFVEAEA